MTGAEVRRAREAASSQAWAFLHHESAPEQDTTTTKAGDCAVCWSRWGARLVPSVQFRTRTYNHGGAASACVVEILSEIEVVLLLLSHLALMARPHTSRLY